MFQGKQLFEEVFTISKTVRWTGLNMIQVMCLHLEASCDSNIWQCYKPRDGGQGSFIVVVKKPDRAVL